MADIHIFNRSTGQEEIEKVYGEAGVSFLYNQALGKLIRPLLTGSFFSQRYGWFQDHPLSRKKVAPFIKNFNIPIQDYEAGSVHPANIENSYKSFNEFFIRKFKPGVREFEAQADIMPAFSEARYYGWESISDEQTFPVKGVYLNAKSLLGSHSVKWSQTFHNGPLLLARLCPVDYHRFHYPDNGQIIEIFDEGNELESVNPLALEAKPEIFLKNQRRVSIIETENFGKLAYIEVGAICVGKIIQSHHFKNFHRGDEKGYFLFGGSTVIVIGEPGKWKPESDILEKTKQQQEVLVQLGQPIAQKY